MRRRGGEFINIDTVEARFVPLVNSAESWPSRPCKQPLITPDGASRNEYRVVIPGGLAYREHIPVSSLNALHGSYVTGC